MTENYCPLCGTKLISTEEGWAESGYEPDQTCPNIIVYDEYTLHSYNHYSYEPELGRIRAYIPGYRILIQYNSTRISKYAPIKNSFVRFRTVVRDLPVIPILREDKMLEKVKLLVLFS